MSELSKEKFQIIGCENSNADEILRPNITYWQDAWRRLKQNKVAIASLIILVLIIFITIFGPMITKFSFEAMDTSNINQRPNKVHWFGTDMLGRDLFARVTKGGRISIIIAFFGAIIDTFVGVIYGGISGYFGGIVDDIMMRIVEILSSIPYLIVVILISILFSELQIKGAILPLIIAMTITGWVGMARLVRGQILQIKEQEYVLAAQALGANSNRIILKHLIPNTIGVMIVAITFDIPSFIFGEAFLSYIGLGVKSPNTSWGALAQSGQQNMKFYPYQLFFPALFISLTMLSFNLLGDGLRDALDPKLRQ